MIDSVHIQDFKAHSDTKLPLGRLTMLVGDNASGKTSVLEALWLMAALAKVPLEELRSSFWPGDLLRRGGAGTISLVAQGTRSVRPGLFGLLVAGARSVRESWRDTVRIKQVPEADNWRFELVDAEPVGLSLQAEIQGEVHRNHDGRSAPQWSRIAKTVGMAGLYSLRASQVSAAAQATIPDVKVERDGAGTAAVLASLKLGADEVFDRIEVDLRQLVPSVRRLRIRQEPTYVGGGPLGHKIYFDFVGAPGIPAHGASQGTLLVLSLLTILHGPNRPNLILLDDFDHALHPRAQMELMRMLKALLALPEFAELQIVATTHSPYTLDELEPKDVHAFALRDDGTVASKCLSQHPDAAKTQGVLRAGQLWSLDPEKSWVLGG